MLKGIHLTLMMGHAMPSPVGRVVIESLQSAEVTVSTQGRSGFQLTFSVGKRSIILTRLLPGGQFDPMVRVQLLVTINGQVTVLMDGFITRHQLTASNEPGKSQLTVTGEDVSQAMDLIDFTGFKFPAIPKEGRVALMLAKYAALGVVPVVIPSVLLDIPNPLEEIPAQTGTDLAYIQALADEVGYVFYVEPGPKPGLNTAYWGPEIKVGSAQPALSINMDAHTNVESLSFSFDGLAKTQYFTTVQNRLTKFPIPIPIPDVNLLNPPLGIKPPIPLRFKPVSAEKDQRGMAKYSVIQAAAIALAKASRSSDVITATGSLDAVRYGGILKARRLVGVRGAGRAHDGLYFVNSVTHNLRPGEYKQNFTLSRNAFISTVNKVSV